jgi:hypothetical protein
LIILLPGHASARQALCIVRDAACYLAFLARLHFVIAGDNPKSCEAHLA